MYYSRYLVSNEINMDRCVTGRILPGNSSLGILPRNPFPGWFPPETRVLL